MGENVAAAGMYLHIPFCLRKCGYCDFVSVPVRARDDARLARYITALEREMAQSAALWEGTRFDSLYFGGGTPSLLPAAHIPALIDASRRHYAIAADCEITVEANPESFTPEKAYAYARAGVNRLSFGVQSAEADELRLLGRPHTFADAQNALDYAKMAGIDNLNVDLIYNLPGQHTERFLQNVHRVLDLGVSHLSCYALILEEGTPLFDAVESRRLPRPDEDEGADMWLAVEDIARRYGLLRYEISNYAKPGAESRHNLHYWRFDSYAGFGAAAHGAMVGGDGVRRTQNAADVHAYIEKGPQTAVELVAGREMMFEYVMLHTRLCEGLSPSAFEAHLGMPFMQVFGDAVRRACDAGLGALTPARFSLTQRGLMLQNTVLQWFLPQ